MDTQRRTKFIKRPVPPNTFDTSCSSAGMKCESQQAIAVSSCVWIIWCDTSISIFSWLHINLYIMAVNCICFLFTYIYLWRKWMLHGTDWVERRFHNLFSVYFRHGAQKQNKTHSSTIFPFNKITHTQHEMCFIHYSCFILKTLMEVSQSGIEIKWSKYWLDRNDDYFTCLSFIRN